MALPGFFVTLPGFYVVLPGFDFQFLKVWHLVEPFLGILDLQIPRFGRW